MLLEDIGAKSLHSQLIHLFNWLNDWIDVYED